MKRKTGKKLLGLDLDHHVCNQNYRIQPRSWLSSIWLKLKVKGLLSDLNETPKRDNGMKTNHYLSKVTLPPQMKKGDSLIVSGIPRLRDPDKIIR